MTAVTTGEPTDGRGDYLWRLGVASVVVVAALAVLAPLREGLVTLTIWSVESSSQLVQLHASVEGDGLITFVSPAGAGFAYRVVEECTAEAVVGLYIVAVLAAPGVAWRRRVVGIVLGSIALLVANWARLLSLAWLGVHMPAAFDMAHVWLWQIVSVALVVVAWFVWLRWAVGRSTSGKGLQHTGWFAGTSVLAGGLLQVSGAEQRYSDGVDRVGQGFQRILEMLPYETLSVASTASEWTVQVRSVSLVLAVALTVASTGPAARRRLAYGALAFPLVFLAQCLGSLLESASAARLEFVGQPALADALEIPLLVVVHGLVTLVPLLLWYRASASAVEPTRGSI